MKNFYVLVPLIMTMIFGLFPKPAPVEQRVFMPTLVVPTETPQPTYTETTGHPEGQVAEVVILVDTPAPVIDQPIMVVAADTSLPVNIVEVTETEPFEFISATATNTYEPTFTPEWTAWIGTPVPDILTSEAYPLQAAPDIDDLWDAVATPQIVPSGSAEICPAPLPMPFVTWEMAVEASLLDGPNSETIELPASAISNIMVRGGGTFPTIGTVIVPEEGLVSYLMEFVLRGQMFICQDINGKPNVYGPGVQEFLNSLSQNYLY